MEVKIKKLDEGPRKVRLKAVFYCSYTEEYEQVISFELKMDSQTGTLK